MLISRRAGARLLTVFLGIVLSCAGVEFVCRVVAPEWSDPWKLWRANPNYILELRPNLVDQLVHGTSREFSFLASTNSQGLRMTFDVPEEKPAGTRRVLFVGDSFTFGFGVEQSETFAANIPDSINAGLAGGVTTDTEYLFTKERGVKWNPDTVVVGVSLRNDLADLEKTRWVYSNDQLVKITEPLSSLPIWLRGSGLFNLFVRGILPKLHLASAPNTQRNLASSQMSSQEKLSWILNAWGNHASENHYRLMLVLIPEKSEVEQPRNESPNTAWAQARVIYRDVAVAARIETFDPLRAMRLHSVRVHRPMYYSIDGHLTKHGHAFLAQWITPRLVVPTGAPIAINPD